MSNLSRSVVFCVLLSLLCLHLQPSEGHITFLSPNEIKILKEKGRKDMEPRSEDGQFQDISIQPLHETEHNMEKSVEVALRLSPQQLDHVAPVLEELIHEMVE